MFEKIFFDASSWKLSLRNAYISNGGDQNKRKNPTIFTYMR